MRVKPINALVISILAVLLGLVAFSKGHDGTVLPVFVAGGVHQSDHLPFDWSRYENPENPEFWDDGDGMPPRPFRYVAAYPTEENKKKLLAWINKQNVVMAEVTKLLGKDFEPYLKELAKGQDPSSVIKFGEYKDTDFVSQNLDWKNISIAYVYRSTCGACVKQAKIIEKIEKLGANIVYLQTDYDKNPPLHLGSKRYTPEFRAAFPHEVTPTLYLKVKGHEAQRVEGFADFESIRNYIENQFGDSQ